jgi:hypothetical protein
MQTAPEGAVIMPQTAMLLSFLWPDLPIPIGLKSRFFEVTVGRRDSSPFYLCNHCCRIVIEVVGSGEIS